ncbi:MAG: hypothetical protein V3S30_10415, partial [Thermoanaerobaculia bacterium]
GMSDLGPLSLGGKDEPVFLGRDFSQRADYSNDTASQIDQEMRRIVDECYQAARTILTEHDTVLERLARDLLEFETLDGSQVYETIREMTGQELGPPEEFTPTSDELQTGESPSEKDGTRESGPKLSDDADDAAAPPRIPMPPDPLPSTE